MHVTLADLQRTYSGRSSEDLLSLHGRGTLTDLAYSALEAELVRRGVAVPPRPAGDAEAAAADDKFRRTTLAAHWRGEAPLASAYWLIGTLGFWLVYGAFVFASQFVPIIAPVLLVVLLAVIVFGWVSIWRCWRNTSWPAWGFVARGLVIIYILVVAASAVNVLYQVRALQ